MQVLHHWNYHKEIPEYTPLLSDIPSISSVIALLSNHSPHVPLPQE